MPRYRDWGGYYGGWAPYVPVAERKRQAAKKIAGLQKKGQSISPIRIEGRTIARTFWGKAWCDNLEAYSDYENRLPRGRSYVRNGSVIHLQIGKGEISALVSGSSLYTVKVAIRRLEGTRWKALIEACSGQIDSLVELLQGRFARGVMEIITCKQRGLFPAPKQISMECSCPDGAIMCKHVAAVLYGVGARLDEQPELFFQLRGVDHSELMTAAGSSTGVKPAAKTDRLLKSGDLSALFGIELDTDASDQRAVQRRARGSTRSGPATKPKRKKSRS